MSNRMWGRTFLERNISNVKKENMMFYNGYPIDIFKILENKRQRKQKKQHAILTNEDQAAEGKVSLEENPDKQVSVNESHQGSAEAE